MGKPKVPSAPSYGQLSGGGLLLDRAGEVLNSDLDVARELRTLASDNIGYQRAYGTQSSEEAKRQQGFTDEQRAFGLEQYNKLYPYLHDYMQGQLDFQRAAQKNQEFMAQESETARQRADETYNRYMTE